MAEVTRRGLCFVITIPLILNDAYVFHQKLSSMHHQNVKMSTNSVENAYTVVTQFDFSQTLASIEGLHPVKPDRRL